jgi:glycosyltransferase involved in cell wall biosynthesis
MNEAPAAVAGDREAAVEAQARELAALRDAPDGASRAGRLVAGLAARSGSGAACNAIDRCQLLLGLRRPRIAVYDHTWHFIGGAQKYGATLAEALLALGDVTLIGNRPFAIADLQAWYRLDLGACAARVIPLPFYEERGGDYIDPARIVSRAMENPFHAVSRASLDYDLFVNNSMLEMVCPLAPRSLFITHFPERRPRSYFYVGRYSRVAYNSRYTRGWIEKRWGLEPHAHVYPPVDMEGGPAEKEPLILSVARFDPGGNKQQLDMLRAFLLLQRSRPAACRGWKLVLAGGSHGDNPYLVQVRDFLRAHPALPVELRVNAPRDEVTGLYRRAALFWHLCGLGQDDPARVEHFGMTVAEAMQNGCVPLVFAGGGMPEIVEDGRSGFLFASVSSLLEQSARLLRDPGLRAAMAAAARQESRRFGKEAFAERVRALAAELLPPPAAGHAPGR